MVTPSERQAVLLALPVSFLVPHEIMGRVQRNVTESTGSALAGASAMIANDACPRLPFPYGNVANASVANPYDCFMRAWKKPGSGVTLGDDRSARVLSWAACTFASTIYGNREGLNS